MVTENKNLLPFYLGEYMNRFWTVCIPCYNPDDRLDNLLQSIVNQNCSDDIEVIVIDDCSTEDFSQSWINIKINYLLKNM